MCISNFQLLLLACLIFVQSSTAAPSLIQKACNITRANVDNKQCITTLQSQPRIASATGMTSLAFRILQAGYRNSTKTRNYIKKLESRSIGGLKECEAAYDLIIPSFRSAREEIRDKDYETATYDLLLAGTDYLSQCENATAAYRIKDGVILRGNTAVKIFVFATYTVADSLGSR